MIVSPLGVTTTLVRTPSRNRFSRIYKSQKPVFQTTPCELGGWTNGRTDGSMDGWMDLFPFRSSQIVELEIKNYILEMYACISY